MRIQIYQPKGITEKQYNFHPKTSHNITKEQLNQLHLGEENFDWIVFVNGKLHKELSKVSIENAEFLSLEYVQNQEQYQPILKQYFNTIANPDLAFTNLNFAFQNLGFFLHIPKNTVIEKPIHLFYLSQNQEENTFYNVRNLLIAEQGSKVEIIESHHNFDESFTLTNSVTEIFVDSNAKADWHKLQNDSATSYLIDHTFAKQERDSLATVNTFSFGGKLVRNNLDFIHNGENINSFMNGLLSLEESSWWIIIPPCITTSQTARATKIIREFSKIKLTACLMVKFLWIKMRKKPMLISRITMYY
ncbi:Fe-S cluster assembly protein SufD [Bergeyella porcorum]|uniref:Fe-S cluster assembly protein SufD n=1 Tax=Bergeyella porcorum TaxID=1735111 RepID=A0AAU0F1J8_9FLAO